MKHLASLLAFLIDQFIADGEQAGKAVLYNSVKLCSVGIIVRFVSESAADGQQALEPGQHRTRGIGIQ